MPGFSSIAISALKGGGGIGGILGDCKDQLDTEPGFRHMFCNRGLKSHPGPEVLEG